MSDPRTYSTAATPEITRDFSGLTDEAACALGDAHMLHNSLDDLELRLFGPTPKSVSEGQSTSGGNNAAPALGQAVRYTRQRLESANSRLSAILERL